MVKYFYTADSPYSLHQLPTKPYRTPAKPNAGLQIQHFVPQNALPKPPNKPFGLAVRAVSRCSLGCFTQRLRPYRNGALYGLRRSEAIRPYIPLTINTLHVFRAAARMARPEARFSHANCPNGHFGGKDAIVRRWGIAFSHRYARTDCMKIQILQRRVSDFPICGDEQKRRFKTCFWRFPTVLF